MYLGIERDAQEYVPKLAKLRDIDSILIQYKLLVDNSRQTEDG